MNDETCLTGVSLLFVVATLTACGGGGGGDGSAATAAPSPSSASPVPPPDSATPTPPSENVAGYAYVANAYSDNVSAFTIDGTTGALSEVEGSPFAAEDHPISVSVDPSGKFAYVANTGTANVSAYAIDAATGALSEVAGSPFGISSVFIAVDPSGKFAYMANRSVSAYSIDASTGALSEIAGSPFATGGVVSSSVTVHPSGKFAYVTNTGTGSPGFQDEHTVSSFAINAATGALTSIGAPVAAGDHPISVTVDPSGKFAYVVNFGFEGEVDRVGNVSVYTINATTGALSEIAGSPFAAGNRPRSVTTTRKIP